MNSNVRLREKRISVLDMVGNVNDFMNLVQQLKQNPMQIVSQRFNIPQNVNPNDPNNIIQHLLNTGQVTQDQVNRAMSLQNNPMLRQFMRR